MSCNPVVVKTFSPYFDQFAIDRLRYELLRKVGWSICSKPDCAQLSDLMVKGGYGQISESTLYRLFFKFEKHRPYKNTLDTLCQYLGYEDSLDFIEQLSEHREALHHNGMLTQKEHKRVCSSPVSSIQLSTL